MGGNKYQYISRILLQAEAASARKQADADAEAKFRSAFEQFQAWRADKAAGRLPMVVRVGRP